MTLDQALAHHQAGRIEEAAAGYRGILECNADDADATYYLGLLECSRGRVEEGLALALRGAGLAPASWRAQAQAGSVLASMGRSAEAIAYLQRALDIERDHPDLLNNTGAVLRSFGRLEEAIALFTEALSLLPAYHDARYNLACTLATAERYGESSTEFEKLLRQQPQSSPLHTAHGNALVKAQRLDEGIAALYRAIELDPGNADAHGYLGNALVERGRLSEGTAAFRQAIDIAPSRPEFYRFLAETKTAELTADLVEALEAMTQPEERRGDDDKIDAHFALGAVYSRRGDYDRSMRHYVAANAHKRRFIAYDEPETLASFDRLIATFDAGFIETRLGCADNCEVPIFIVGMPRSGTTLVEQIVANHPGVYGAGELLLFEQITNAVLSPEAPPTPETMLAASCEQLRCIGSGYAAALRAYDPVAIRITDKMPSNFRYLGLIATVLPNARIVHLNRDPVDTCLSCFEHYFAGEQPWAYDLAELGRYYRSYARLMDHWRAVLPTGAMLDVVYEHVVADVESQARRIIAYCGLPWDEACLQFFTSDRPVRTASAAQVRRPIYSESVGRWRSLDRERLRPLLDGLGGALRTSAWSDG